MDSNVGTQHRILKRGALIYYAGSAIFASGIALLALGVAFIMMQKIHYGSEPGEIFLSSIFIGVGATMILTGMNMMMRQTRYGHYLVGASTFASLFALLVFTYNYPQKWYYPLINYVLALYVVGLLVLVGNAFANVVLWMIEGEPGVAVRKEELRIYTDEEIERDIEDATRKSIELSASELTFKEPYAEDVKYGRIFRETRGTTTRIKDNLDEVTSLVKTVNPGGRIKSGSAEIESASKNLVDILRVGSVKKSKSREIKDKVVGTMERFYSLITVKRGG
ncbi:MAG: hypothetical protein EMLJLAPB_01209 [Candidatus Argoarchaeum ethanivorans]|uniref:Cell division protein A N-terminal domain-containing protein n=1 Tax=Candidatus Argoarchaeum ethanivorans TaxID=2608793 RepID=A0A811TC64_9EURY|nr:MAG: hypothetical protein EMLJLAPB_01209 [Candidatus Argoarchaeum ethanivorans]